MSFLQLILLPTIILSFGFSILTVGVRGYGQGLSPRVIAFSASVQGFESSQEIWLMEVDSRRNQRLLHIPHAGRIVWSPNLMQFAYTSYDYAQRKPYLNLMTISGELSSIPTQQHLEFLFWSPDGQWLAGVAPLTRNNFYTKGVYLLRADGSDVQQISTLDVAPSWSSDGERLFYLDADNTHFTVNELDVQTREINIRHEIEGNPRIISTSWSPDGQWFVYVRQDPNVHTLLLVNLSDNSETTLTTRRTRPFIRGWLDNGQRFAYSNRRYSPLKVVDLQPPFRQQQFNLGNLSELVADNSNGGWLFVAAVDVPIRREVFHMDTNGQVHRLTNSYSEKDSLAWWIP